MTEQLVAGSALVRAAKYVFSRVGTLEDSVFLKLLSRGQTAAKGGLGALLAQWGLAALVFGAVFIPRFRLGDLFGHYSIDLKVEDLILGALLLCIGIIRPKVSHCPWRQAIEAAFLCFLTAAALSISVGIAAGTLDKPLMSLLCLVKWAEYFLIFILAARLSTAKTCSFFAAVFFWLGIGLAAYGYYEHFYPVSAAAYPNYYRLYERPPFHGDANHIGGLLAMWLSFFSAAYLRSFPHLILPRITGEDRGGGRHSLLLLGAILFVFFPFIWTFSRKSYFAFAGAFIVLVFLARGAWRRWVFLGCLLVLAGLLLPTRLAERVSDLGTVMTAVDPYHSSWAGNMDVWKRCFVNFNQFWLFGAGMGARHRLFYESQYVMTLTEMGILGLFTLAVLLAVPALLALKRLRDPMSGGLAGAYLAGWAAFVLHNLSCVSLTVSKTAVVWWFLTGVWAGALGREHKA